MKYSHLIISLICSVWIFPTNAGDSVTHTYAHVDSSRTVKKSNAVNSGSNGVPAVRHGHIGDISQGYESILRLKNVDRRQNFDWQDKSTLDGDIYSPKSVNFHPGGKKIYVNSLEGCRTVVYDIDGSGALKKRKAIKHDFKNGGGSLMSAKSGFYDFTHYAGGEKRDFSGKPVEGCFSHGGRWFWVPYYRRTFDINAQDPSAIAVIDTRTDSIVRIMETGPLPKMVAYGKDAGLVAVTHWGDNTVGLIDVSSDSPADWRHLQPLVAGSRFKLDFPLDRSVDRDANSGLKLRGTVFTPDGRYLLVSAMSGPLQVFDVKEKRYLGSVQSAYSVRHLVIDRGTLYGTQNGAGTVVSVPLESVLKGIEDAEESGSRNISVSGWRTCKVGGGARTLEVSPDGKFLFVACNSASEMYVVDAAEMKVVDRITVDSYPVGLDVSPSGKYVAVTSQGRKGHGGNALNIFEVLRTDITDTLVTAVAPESVDSVSAGSDENMAGENAPAGFLESFGADKTALALLLIIAVLVVARIAVHIRRARH